MTTVLYIEDNDRNVFMLKHRLKSRGFEVLVATGGEHGVQTAQLEHPDIILMDLLAGNERLAG
jgi:two-component system cell cycle response regulator DivK